MFWFLIYFPNWITPNGKAKDGTYRRGSLLCFILFWCCEWKMNIDITDHIPIFIFLFWIKKKGKGNLMNPFPFSIWNQRTKKRKDDIYNTWCFSVFPVVILQKNKRKEVQRIIFLFFVWGLGKRKRMLICPFSIFYYEIEKRKTKGRYIHGPGQKIINLIHWKKRIWQKIEILS